MTRGTYTYIFGPVLSRRLGKSLGIDIIPFKTCTYDCIYCEQGRTTNRTSERKEYVPVDEVLQELKEVLDRKPELNFITFSGAGEPTLNSGLGRVVDFIKNHYPQYKLCLLTNGCEIGYSVTQAWSVSAMVVAVAYACTLG